MSKEKQIEEMANTIYDNRPHKDVWLEDAQDIAKVLYDAGYRKQRVGEWESNHQTDEYICSLCGAIAPVDCLKEDFYKSNFCPNCGAKMKGGEE